MQNRLRTIFIDLGDYSQFAGKFFRSLFKRPFEFQQIMRHIDELGAFSTPLVLVANFLMGLILAMQSRPTMVKFGAAELIPALVTRSITRELGSVITGLIVAGRVASGISAELGSMKVTEQIEAMECSGVDPYKYLVTTRIIAVMFLMPVITLFADFIGIFGSFVAETLSVNVSLRYYYSQVVDVLYVRDIVPGVLKTMVFGFAIAMIGCYKGFHTTSGTEGVGRSTTSSVVLSSLWIIFIDMILVKITVTFFPEV